jgi:hypothetical protein
MQFSRGRSDPSHGAVRAVYQASAATAIISILVLILGITFAAIIGGVMAVVLLGSGVRLKRDLRRIAARYPSDS